MSWLAAAARTAAACLASVADALALILAPDEEAQAAKASPQAATSPNTDNPPHFFTACSSWRNAASRGAGIAPDATGWTAAVARWWRRAWSS